MSYVFTSPKYNVRQCPTDDSLGLVGPDQPWTKETAGKEIVPATKDCHRGWQSVWNWEGAEPHFSVGRNKVNKNCSNPAPEGCRTDIAVRDYRMEDCFKTGRIDEAYKPGHDRHEWWCCPPVPEMKPKREATQTEVELYGECQPFFKEGEVYLGEPRWLDNNFLIPTGWDGRETDVIDNGYRLFCQAILPKDYFRNIGFAGGGKMTVVNQAIMDAQEVLKREEKIAEEAAVVQAAVEEFDYSFFDRYGLYMALGAGVIGVSLIAGLIKRSIS